MTKSPSAFKTITEVAEHLKLPAHVLRFWESKFPQIEPLKRGGGRRYYRVEDVAVVTRIRDLLHTQGYTIRGVQQLFKQETKAKPPLVTLPVATTAVAANQDILPLLRDIRNDLQDVVGRLRKIA